MKWLQWTCILVPMLLSSCNPMASVSTAERATQTFYDRMAKGQADAIYAETTPAFQKSSDRHLFNGMLARINRKLGGCQTATTRGKNISAFPTGVFVTFGNQRQCTGGILSETFTWQIVGGSAKLQGYQATSPSLAVD